MTLNRLKVTLNRTTRLVPVNDYSWNYLQSILRERFSLSPETSLQLTYLDHDGDNITISSDAELEEAILALTDSAKVTLVIQDPTAQSTNGEESVSSTEAIHTALKNLTLVPTGTEHEEDESDLFSELGSDESLEDFAERQRDDKGKGREWDLVSMEEGQGSPEDDTVSKLVETTIPTVHVEPTHVDVEAEDPEEDVLPLPEVTPTSSSSSTDDPADVPLPTGTPPTTSSDPFATLRASLAEAFPSLPQVPHFSLPPGLDPNSIERIASLISLAPLAPLAEVPSLVRDIGTEITSIVGLVFKGFREEAESVRGEFERFKKEMEERKKKEEEEQGPKEEEERESETKGETEVEETETETETKEEKSARRMKKKEMKMKKKERKVMRDAKRKVESEFEEETITATCALPVFPPHLSALLSGRPVPPVRPASDPFYFPRPPLPTMPGTFDVPPTPRPDPFGFATPEFRLPSPPPSRMPGSFQPRTHYQPIPSTSALGSQWSEVTPGQLRRAVEELGMDMRDVGVNIVIERVWEEKRGNKLEEMVMEVVERLM